MFNDGAFIPYADLGFHHDLGFYRLSEVHGLPNEAAPFAATGKHWSIQVRWLLPA
ncbi:MAG: hypothetical protein R3C44_16620 [Chloroflexota bacterium]